ncbi:ankyrin repeat domain-containing protein [Aspergillus undulatus]|uniref:ankyrin repeat domain-containing protein n=1 Tax=Aspergillus undulatus TaxID=1810928 RepID=UPI003CCC9A55
MLISWPKQGEKFRRAIEKDNFEEATEFWEYDGVLNYKALHVGRASTNPLLLAAENGSLNVFKALLASGANPAEQTGKYAARSPLKGPNVWDSGPNALHVAACYGHLEILRIILEAGSDMLQSKCAEGRTALSYAAFSGHDDVFEFLLEQGADVTAVDCNRNIVLHHAAWGGHCSFIKKVLEMRRCP